MILETEYAFAKLHADKACSVIRDTNLPSQNAARRNGMTFTDCRAKHYRGVDMPHNLFSVNDSDRLC